MMEQGKNVDPEVIENPGMHDDGDLQDSLQQQCRFCTMTVPVRMVLPDHLY